MACTPQPPDCCCQPVANGMKQTSVVTLPASPVCSHLASASSPGGFHSSRYTQLPLCISIVHKRIRVCVCVCVYAQALSHIQKRRQCDSHLWRHALKIARAGGARKQGWVSITSCALVCVCGCISEERVRTSSPARHAQWRLAVTVMTRR